MVVLYVKEEPVGSTTEHIANPKLTVAVPSKACPLIH